MEDPKKVQEKIDELNKDYPPAKWDSVVGFHSTSAVTIDGTNQSIDPSRGITYKLFANTETGEVKFFYYRNFIKKIRLKKPDVWS